MIGEGKKAKRERRETRMTREAALSLGSTARRLMMVPPTLPVEPSKERVAKIMRVR